LVAFCGGGASVTPGLDGSYILMLGGTYQPALGAVAALAHLEIRWGILLTTALGAVLGILICSKFIDIAIRRAPSVTYYVVLGLVIGSVYGLWPDQPARLAWPFLVILFLAGNILAYYAGRKQVPPKVSPAKMTD
jgi:putative membrane protein